MVQKNRHFSLLGDSIEGFVTKYFYVVSASMPACWRLCRLNDDDLEVYKFPHSWLENVSFSGRCTVVPDLSVEEARFYCWVNEYVSFLSMSMSFILGCSYFPLLAFLTVFVLQTKSMRWTRQFEAVGLDILGIEWKPLGRSICLVGSLQILFNLSKFK